MKNPQLSRVAFSLLAGLLLVAGATQIQASASEQQDPELAGNKPEALGFSSERLERLHAAMQREVDQKQLAGIVTILARHGKVVEERTTARRTSQAARR